MGGLFHLGNTLMDLRALLTGLVFAVMWSSAFTSARIAVADAPPLLILGVRFLVSGVLAIVIARAIGQKMPVGRRQWAAVALFGICQNTLYLGLNFTAMQWVEASVAVIISSALPLSVAAAGWLVTRERLSRQAVLGLLAGTAGVALIMADRLSGGADPLGVALCVLGVLALTLATLLVRGMSARGDLLMVVGLQMLFGAVTLMPVSIVMEPWQIDWTISLVLSVLYIIFIPGLAATLVWFHLVHRIGATRAASFHFLNPFLGIAIAALVLGEAISPRDILGVVIIMAGILAVQTARN